MSFSKILLIFAALLFGVVGVLAFVKKMKVKDRPVSSVVVDSKETANSYVSLKKETISSSAPIDVKDDFPLIDRIHQLFTAGPSRLPIVETVKYSSKVSWLKGRPAWIADYATHYATSRHFIARSLQGKAVYQIPPVAEGASFNVFRKDKNFQFYLLADISLCKMGFYYIDLDTKERVLLKTYRIALGKVAKTESGSLTPLGKYKLGNKIAIYSPGVAGVYHNREIEMIRVFGTRWIPFESLEGSSEKIKGVGLNGFPWVDGAGKDQLVENRSLGGKYETDGCLALAHEDIEELFAIVVSKPTVIEIVKHFKEAHLPGVEVASPMR